MNALGMRAITDTGEEMNIQGKTFRSERVDYPTAKAVDRVSAQFDELTPEEYSVAITRSRNLYQGATTLTCGVAFALCVVMIFV